MLLSGLQCLPRLQLLGCWDHPIAHRAYPLTLTHIPSHTYLPTLTHTYLPSHTPTYLPSHTPTYPHTHLHTLTHTPTYPHTHTPTYPHRCYLNLFSGAHFCLLGSDDSQEAETWMHAAQKHKGAPLPPQQTPPSPSPLALQISPRPSTVTYRQFQYMHPHQP